VGGPGAAGRGRAAQGQDPAARSAAHHRGDRLGARERGHVAGDPGRARPLVAGRAALRPLVRARGLAAPARGGAGARRRARHGVPRRDLDQGAPEGRGRGQKGAVPPPRARAAGSAPRRASSPTAGAGRSPSRQPPARPTSCRSRPGPSTVCPACRSGPWATAATTRTSCANGSDRAARDPRSRPGATRRR
jgi:hypothetical protein